MRRSNFALRLLPSLADELKRVTGDEGISVNQFINIAVAEKLSAIKTANFFAERIKCANPDDMLSILELAGADEMETECHDLIERNPGTRP